MTSTLNRWAVVGGGMMGLTIAWRLAKAGKPVVLFEASDVLGGLASPWQFEDLLWDRHYHVTLLSDSNTRRILSDLELEQSMRWVTTKTGFSANGKLVSMSNALEYLALPGMSMLDKVRVAGTIILGSKVTDWRKLEKMPVEEWLTRYSGKTAFQRLWRPLLEAKLGDRWKDSSAAFIWATIQRLYAARRTGLKREMFGYVPGGYACVVRAFEEKLRSVGVEIRKQCPITSIRHRDGKNTLETASGTFEFDRVVLTTTPKQVNRLCPDLTSEERAAFGSVEYQGVVCASILLEKPLADYYLTYLTDDWVPFTAVVEMSAFVDPADFGGRTLVYLPKYAGGSDPVFAKSDADLQHSYENALRRLYPHFAQNRTLAFKVSRVKEVFPIPRLGYSEHLPPIVTSLPGVIAISSAHIVNGTLNVNDTLAVAERAAVSLLLHDGMKLYLD
jgi:protoporphyrinogen oxidase